MWWRFPGKLLWNTQTKTEKDLMKVRFSGVAYHLPVIQRKHKPFPSSFLCFFEIIKNLFHYTDSGWQGMIQVVFDIGTPIFGTSIWTYPNLILSKIKSIKNVIQFLELIKIRIRNTNIMTKKMKNKCNARFIWTPWSKFGVIYALFFFCCNANLASDLYFFFLYHFLVFSVSTEIKRTCAYLGVRNVSFSGNFAYVLNGWPPFEWCVEF